MAVSANQILDSAADDNLGVPVAASTRLWSNTLAYLASGYLDDDTAAGANKFAGIVTDEKDNSGGSAGDIKGEVRRTGKYLLTGTGFTQATVGSLAYGTDNFTVTDNGAAEGAVYIGRFAEYYSSTQMWVEIDPVAFATATSADAITTQVLTFDGATGVNEVHIPTNLADALSIEIATVGDLLAVDTSTGAVAVTITTTAAAGLTLAGHVTMGDAKNIILNATTGTKIGTATTQKLGFFNATPVVQRSAYTQTYSTADKTHSNPTAVALTDNSAGTANTTIQALADGTTYANDVAAIRNNFADLAASDNAIIVDLADLKALVNSVIDDLQALGLVG